MGIQFTETPEDCSRVGQKLIFIAITGNVYNNGFRYVYQIIVGDDDPATAPYYFVKPNFNDCGVFDASPIIYERVRGTSDSNIHSTSFGMTFDDEINKQYRVNCYEGWIVDGAFTINEEVKPAIFGGCFYRGAFQYMDGFKPNPNDYGWRLKHHSLLGEYSGFNSAINFKTFETPFQLVGHPIHNGPEDIIIPATAQDSGVMYVHKFDDKCNLGTSPESPFPFITMEIYNEGGALLDSPTLSTEPNNESRWKGCGAIAFPFYPRNVSSYLGLYPDWYAYSLQAFGDYGSGLVPMSSKYIVYNSEPCLSPKEKTRYNSLRIGWYNKYGGVDYFTFPKAHTYTAQMERKRYKRVEGNYATAMGGGEYEVPFSINKAERGLQETKVQSYLTLELNSDWISENTFAFLREIRESHNVFIIGDNNFFGDDIFDSMQTGETIPVVVEDSSYVIQRIRSGQKYNQKLLIRFAHDTWTA
jgi:hypothetical protein